MSYSKVDPARDSKGVTSTTSITGTSPDSHFPPLNHGHIELELISLFDDFNSERVYEDSLKEGASSSDSLETILSNVGREVNRVEVPIPPPIFT